MSATSNRQKSQAMAADLLRRGFWHGRRASKGLSNIPNLTDHGSAAHRRAQAAAKRQTPRHARG